MSDPNTHTVIHGAEPDPTEPSAKITPEDAAARDVRNAVECVVEMAERFAYGGVAFGVTYVSLTGAFHVEPGHAVEPAMLNAAVAYYSHAATGRVIRALVVLAKRPRGHFYVTASQHVKEEEPEAPTTSR